MGARISHRFWTLGERQGFTPAAFLVPTLFGFRATRSLRSQAAPGAEQGEPREHVLTVGL